MVGAQYKADASSINQLSTGGATVNLVACAGDDLQTKWAVSFTSTLKLKPGETVVFSWIVFKSRADRDRINKKVMKDPRLAKMMDMKAIPFDSKRMVYGGFKTLVDLA